MTELIKKEREFVVPGDEIVKSMDYLPGRNCFREGDAICARKIGLVSLSGRVISVIPLNGAYVPKVGDMVIATVEDIPGTRGWVMNINSPYRAFLPLSGVRDFIDTNRTSLDSVYRIGDVLYAKIHSISGIDMIDISMQDPRARKLRGGRIIKINPSKVPRMIGKQGSMISMIKDRTASRISIGQNGYLWMEGGDEKKVMEAIDMIDREAYMNGLTDKVSKLLGEPKPAPRKEEPKAEEKPAEEKPKVEEKEEKK
ncbi:MAG: exosome complex RNA-binding protein Rrp4 [Candidatus Aenigmarchaeota archaeon]